MASVNELKRHELSAIMGDMSEGEYDHLVDSVSRNGFINRTIVVYEGKVLDGWHRYRAALDLDLEIGRGARYDLEITEANGVGSAMKYVIDANVHRRHLTPSQKAIIGARMVRYDRGRPTQAEEADRNLWTTEEIANSLGVSERSISSARTVIQSGIPEFVEAVSAGAVTVSDAATAIVIGGHASTPEEQREALALVERGAFRTLAAAIEPIKKRSGRSEIAAPSMTGGHIPDESAPTEDSPTETTAEGHTDSGEAGPFDDDADDDDGELVLAPTPPEPPEPAPAQDREGELEAELERLREEYRTSEYADVELLTRQRDEAREEIVRLKSARQASLRIMRALRQAAEDNNLPRIRQLLGLEAQPS